MHFVKFEDQGLGTIAVREQAITATRCADNWMDYLSEDVERRLGNCHSLRSDIEQLVNARWYWMKENGKDKQGFTKEDALVYILDLLDCNSQYIDLTKAEYDALCRE